jgi:cytochrome P450
MFKMTVTWLDIFLGALGFYLVQRIFNIRGQTILPPGPPKWPLLGNLLDMPTTKEWLTFAQWGRTYGDISSVTVLGQPLVILNSAKTAVDMLEKKSSKYSDRPVLPMGGELVGWKNTLVLVPYGDRFKEYRKYFHQLIGNRQSMVQFHPVEERETHIFLQNVLDKPTDLAAHVRKTAGAIILRISYGYELQGDHDPFVELADKATVQFSLSTAPGAFLVDFIPFLKYIPAWVPGAGFQRIAKEWSDTLNDMVDMPYNFTKQQMGAGIAPPSFTSNLLETSALGEKEEFNIKWSAASLYSGGADTTVSAIYSLFLALTLFPEVQKKAQAEIDAVVGNDRLPKFTDRSRLPYIDALAKEVLRWNTVVPLAVAHRVQADDIHEGYLIPKGALVIPNIWQMLRDPRIYPNPSEFDPERYIAAKGKEPQQDPRTITFGFGRRICPGLNLADASVFISCAMSLAVFDIAKAVENGVEITPVVDNTPGTISHPVPYKCSIKPRSAKAVGLIRQDPGH